MVFVNAVNLIDGIDGLAAGIAAIASVTFFLTGLNLGNPRASLFALAMLGATFGFLRYNLFPATIFMGDTGSMFVGFSLAAIAMLGAGKSVALVALLIPILALGVPLLDTFLAIFRRSKSRHGIFNADRSHIHHKLLDLGFSARQTVLILWVAAILLSIVAVALSTANRGLVLLFIGFSLVGFSVLVGMVRSRR
jgi:UDP-GlcNAc:undecaprenyl-phosphate GlcNAc-1-phosphate transferase